MDQKTIMGILGTISATAVVEVGYLFVKVHVMSAELEQLKLIVYSGS